MQQPGFLANTNIWIVFIGIIGSAVRLLYGYFNEPWDMAADHIAWEIIIQNGSYRYSELIHYPHEGGTIVISLISKVMASIFSFNALAITAFILDFLVRCIQIWIVKRVFTPYLALVFGLFTLFAYPIMIPWGTVNFGLHSFSSLFPFLLLYTIKFWQDSTSFQIKIGLFSALAIWFSYINLTLLPILLGFIWFHKKNKGNWYSLVIPFLIIMGIHILILSFFDAGFQLEEITTGSIRNTKFALFNIQTWINLIQVPNTFANAATVSSSNTIHLLTKILFIGFSIIASINLFRMYYTDKWKNTYTYSLSIIILFLIAYGISPFFTSAKSSDFVLYRHLTYIFPLFGLMILIGLQNTYYKIIYSFLFIFAGIIGSTQMIEPTPKSVTTPPAQTAGWVLGTKFGHAPLRLYQLIRSTPQKDDLIVGIGWGSSTAIFNHIKFQSTSEIQNKTQQLHLLLDSYPQEYKPNLVKGVRFSFSPKVTPLLDTTILQKLNLPAN